MITLDTTVEELFEMDLLKSIRAFNCCKLAKFVTVEDLMCYYQGNGNSFMSLRNCGKKTNIELIEVCQNLVSWGVKPICYDKIDEPIEEGISIKQIQGKLKQMYLSNGLSLSVSLQQLYDFGYIKSIRCVNSCFNYDIITLFDLLEYYLLNGTFLGVRNLGKKSEKELLDIVSPVLEEYKSIKNEVHVVTISERKEVCSTKFDVFFKSFISDFCIDKGVDISSFDSFSFTDSKNSVNNRFGINDVYLFHDFVKYYFLYAKKNEIDRDISGRLNAVFFNYLDSFPSKLLEAVSEMDEALRLYVDVKCDALLYENKCPVSISGFRKLIEYCFSYDIEKRSKRSTTNKLLSELYDFICKSRQLDVKKCIVQDVREFIRLDRCDYNFVADFILSNNCFPLFYLLEHYYKDIMVEYKLAKRKKSLKSGRLKSIVSFAFRYGIGGGEHMTLKQISNCMGVSTERIRQYAKKGVIKTIGFDRYNWNGYFANRVNAVGAKYVLNELPTKIKETERLDSSETTILDVIEELSAFLVFNYNNQKYILSVEKKEQKKVEKAIKTVLYEVEQKRVEDKVVLIKDYFPSNIDVKYVNALVSLISVILENDNCCSVYGDKLILYKNQHKNIEELSVAVLEESGKPMTAEEILQKVLEKEPTHKVTNVSQLKHYLFVNEKIHAIGKTGLYGLIKWGVKTVTIRGLAAEYLIQKGTPQKIECIFDYVSRVFPNLNIHSLETNLKLDKKIVFVGNGTYALLDQKYSFDESKTSITITQLIKDLKCFIESNRSFPAAFSIDQKEENLHDSWYDVIERLDELSFEDRNAINEFKELYECFIPKE